MNPTNTDLAAALREIAESSALGTALILNLAADRLESSEPSVCEDPDALADTGDGWIVWDGSKYDQDSSAPFTPVPRGSLIDVKFRDGVTYTNVPAGENLPPRSRDAAGSFWQNEGGGNDIVAYRFTDA